MNSSSNGTHSHPQQHQNPQNYQNQNQNQQYQNQQQQSHHQRQHQHRQHQQSPSPVNHNNNNHPPPQHQPQIHTPSDISVYNEVLLQSFGPLSPNPLIEADLYGNISSSVCLPGNLLVPFLSSSNLPNPMLSKMWSLADPNLTGTLTQITQWYLILRSVSICQHQTSQGAQPDISTPSVLQYYEGFHPGDIQGQGIPYFQPQPHQVHLQPSPSYPPPTYQNIDSSRSNSNGSVEATSSPVSPRSKLTVFDSFNMEESQDAPLAPMTSFTTGKLAAAVEIEAQVEDDDFGVFESHKPSPVQSDDDYGDFTSPKHSPSQLDNYLAAVSKRPPSPFPSPHSLTLSIPSHSAPSIHPSPPNSAPSSPPQAPLSTGINLSLLLSSPIPDLDVIPNSSSNSPPSNLPAPPPLQQQLQQPDFNHLSISSPPVWKPVSAPPLLSSSSLPPPPTAEVEEDKDHDDFGDFDEASDAPNDNNSSQSGQMAMIYPAALDKVEVDYDPFGHMDMEDDHLPSLHEFAPPIPIPSVTSALDENEEEEEEEEFGDFRESEVEEGAEVEVNDNSEFGDFDSVTGVDEGVVRNAEDGSDFGDFDSAPQDVGSEPEAERVMKREVSNAADFDHFDPIIRDADLGHLDSVTLENVNRESDASDSSHFDSITPDVGEVVNKKESGADAHAEELVNSEENDDSDFGDFGSASDTQKKIVSRKESDACDYVSSTVSDDDDLGTFGSGDASDFGEFAVIDNEVNETVAVAALPRSAEPSSSDNSNLPLTARLVNSKNYILLSLLLTHSALAERSKLLNEEKIEFVEDERYEDAAICKKEIDKIKKELKALLNRLNCENVEDGVRKLMPRGDLISILNSSTSDHIKAKKHFSSLLLPQPNFNLEDINEVNRLALLECECLIWRERLIRDAPSNSERVAEAVNEKIVEFTKKVEEVGSIAEDAKALVLRDSRFDDYAVSVSYISQIGKALYDGWSSFVGSDSNSNSDILKSALEEFDFSLALLASKGFNIEKLELGGMNGVDRCNGGTTVDEIYQGVISHEIKIEQLEFCHLTSVPFLPDEGVEAKGKWFKSMREANLYCNVIEIWEVGVGGEKRIEVM